MQIIYSTLIIIFSIAGFLLARYIKKTKQAGAHMVCPLGHDCKSVVSGRFSKFLGIHVEDMGMGYYLASTLFYIMSITIGFNQSVMFYAVLVSGAAFAFSGYLLLTQLVALKKWCTLCIGSAAISFMIMVLVFIGFESSFFEFIYDFRDLLRWLFAGAVIVGALVTTFYMRLFVKFLRDFEISKKEVHRLKMFSQTGWVAIGLALLAGIGLAISDQYGEVLETSSFIVMAVTVGVLVFYEVIVNLFISPKLIDIHFGDHPELDDHTHSYQRKTAFAFTAVGVASWYMLALMTFISFWRWSSGALFLTYLGLVLVSVILAMLAETIFYRKSVRTHSFVESIDGAHLEE